MTYLLALDQGTSSSRSILFNQAGSIVATAQQEFKQYFPQPGWVEHDALEIWQTQQATMHAVLAQAQISPHEITAIGITNQRETTVLWDKTTGQPLAPAIVWQDRRTADYCAELRQQGWSNLIREKTGLVIDPYFSASKLRYLLQTLPGAMQRARAGELAFGTIDSWLLWQLSGGKRHATDISNASRTQLFNLRQACWDQDLLDLFEIPSAILPEVCPSSHHYAYARFGHHRIPITGIAGDQQAALFGQACFEPGMAKNTYGTGCFMLLNTGKDCHYSENGLITTATAQTNEQPGYALEGSVFMGGAIVQWLRDSLHAVNQSSAIEDLARSVSDTGGVIFVPAFTGLGAPYWQADARGAILGLSRGSQIAHIARAALEAIAYQSHALLLAMCRDAGTALNCLRVDGGAARNDLLLQFQADLSGIPVLRPAVTETTALGAAWLAGIGAGVYADQQECARLWQIEREFFPQMSRDQALTLMQQWEDAVKRVC